MKRPEASAATIQKVWRGAKQRESMAKEAARKTPYPSQLQYKFSTNGFSAQAKRRDETTPGSLETEWSAYASTANLGASAPALLSSHQRRERLTEAVSALYRGSAPEGAEYQPNGIHTMRANSAWLLGLAHRKIPAVLTTPVERHTVIRHDLTSTALARELVGMVRSGHFATGAAGSRWQALVPKESASTARLEDFKTPRAMSLDFVKSTLDDAGVDTARLKSAGELTSQSGK